MLEWGFAVEYGLIFLQEQVKDIGLPAPFNRLIPLIEFSFETALNRGEEGQTTGTMFTKAGPVKFIAASILFLMLCRSVVCVTLRQMQSAMQSAKAVVRSSSRRGIHSRAPRSFLTV